MKKSGRRMTGRFDRDPLLRKRAGRPRLVDRVAAALQQAWFDRVNLRSSVNAGLRGARSDVDRARVRRGLARRVRRLRKFLTQRLRAAPADPRTVFVLGCQRSGTDMLMRVLDATPESWSYDEDSPAAFDHFQLRPFEVIDRLVARGRAQIVAFKSICDAHRADELLARYPRSRVVWIYRRYQDVANSAVVKWQGHQRDVMHWIHQRDFERLGWRGERLPEDFVALVDSLEPDALTAHEGAALFWLLRNRFYFELGLDRRPDVLLVRYEDLVQDPRPHAERVFRFLDLEFDPTYVAGLRSSSVGRRPFPEIREPIARRCEEMTERLDACYRAVGSGSTAAAPSRS
jgi:hypothetical protein